MKKMVLVLVALLVTVASFSQTRCGVCNGHGKFVCRVCGGYGVMYQNYYDPFWGTWRTASYYCAGCGGQGAVFLHELWRMWFDCQQLFESIFQSKSYGILFGG